MTLAEIVKKWCVCADDYTLRGRVDPMCRCDDWEDAINEAVGEDRERCAEWLRERARSVLSEAKKLPLGAVHDGGNLHGASRYNVQGEIYKALQWAGNVLVRERNGEVKKP